MRTCPLCGEQMVQDSNVDEFPSDIWNCPTCGHTEENQEAEDYDPNGLDAEGHDDEDY